MSINTLKPLSWDITNTKPLFTTFTPYTPQNTLPQNILTHIFLMSITSFSCFINIKLTCKEWHKIVTSSPCLTIAARYLFQTPRHWIGDRAFLTIRNWKNLHFHQSTYLSHDPHTVHLSTTGEVYQCIKKGLNALHIKNIATSKILSICSKPLGNGEWLFFMDYCIFKDVYPSSSSSPKTLLYIYNFDGVLVKKYDIEGKVLKFNLSNNYIVYTLENNNHIHIIYNNNHKALPIYEAFTIRHIEIYEENNSLILGLAFHSYTLIYQFEEIGTLKLIKRLPNTANVKETLSFNHHYITSLSNEGVLFILKREQETFPLHAYVNLLKGFFTSIALFKKMAVLYDQNQTTFYLYNIARATILGQVPLRHSVHQAQLDDEKIVVSDTHTFSIINFNTQPELGFK